MDFYPTPKKMAAFILSLKRTKGGALAGVAQWIERWPTTQKGQRGKRRR